MCRKPEPQELSKSSSSSMTSSPTVVVGTHDTNGVFRTFVPALSVLFILLSLILNADKGTSVPIGGGGGGTTLSIFGTSISSSNPTATTSSTVTTTTTSSSSSSTVQRDDPTIHDDDGATKKSIIQKKERGKVVGGQFTAKSLYDAYKEMQTEYLEKAFGASHDQWRLLTDKQGVEVSMMELPSDPTCPYVKMTAIIPTPVEECWDFLELTNWDQNMPKMDPFYEGVSIYGEYEHQGVHMVLARKRTQRIFAFGKRDFTFLSVSDQPLPDGSWVSGTVSIQTSQLPRQVGYTRAYQDSLAFYKPIDNNSKTHVTIICRMDLNDSAEDGSGGWMPMWLYVKTVGTTGNKSVINMRNVLIENQKQQQREQSQSSQEQDETVEPNQLQQQQQQKRSPRRRFVPWNRFQKKNNDNNQKQ